MDEDRPDATTDGPPPIDGGTIAGRVTDFEGVPIVGVRVEAKAGGDVETMDLLPVVTDGGGRFLLEGLQAERYDLAFGKGTVRARVEAVPVGTDALHVRLARPQGVVLDVRTGPGEPVPDVVQFALWRQGPERWVREYLGRALERRMLIAGLRPGTWRLLLFGPPYAPVEVPPFAVRAGEAADDVEVHLGLYGGFVAGQFVAGPGRTRSGWAAWRRIDAPEILPHEFRSTAMAEDGMFHLSGLAAGTYEVACWSDDGDVAVERIAVHEGGGRPADPQRLVVRGRAGAGGRGGAST